MVSDGMDGGAPVGALLRRKRLLVSFSTMDAANFVGLLFFLLLFRVKKMGYWRWQ